MTNAWHTKVPVEAILQGGDVAGPPLALLPAGPGAVQAAVAQETFLN